MEAVSSRPIAANDRCVVSRATPFHQLQLKAVLDAAALEKASALDNFDASELLADQVVLLAFSQDVPVGCIMAMPGHITVLHGLFVAPEYRGNGHGSELIRSALEAFDQLNSTRTYWTAIDPALVGARERFLKFGFEIVPELSDSKLRLMVRSGCRPTETRDAFKSHATPSFSVAERSTRTHSAV